jgi:hypothetical protein
LKKSREFLLYRRSRTLGPKITILKMIQHIGKDIVGFGEFSG